VAVLVVLVGSSRRAAFFCPHRWGSVAVAPSRTHRLRCSNWRGDGTRASLFLRSAPTRFLLEVLVVALNSPTHLRLKDHALQRHLLGQRGQPDFIGSLWPCGHSMSKHSSLRCCVRWWSRRRATRERRVKLLPSRHSMVCNCDGASSNATSLIDSGRWCRHRAGTAVWAHGRDRCRPGAAVGRAPAATLSPRPSHPPLRASPVRSSPHETPCPRRSQHRPAADAWARLAPTAA
jgi:hypothetical protein